MAIKPKDIYHGRKKARSPGGVILLVLVLLLAAALALFYGLRQFAVYDENGNATIIFPWDRGEAEESPPESPDASLIPSETPPADESPSASPEPPSSASPEAGTSPSPSAGESPTPPASAPVE
jgi:hypothetical protein